MEENKTVSAGNLLNPKRRPIKLGSSTRNLVENELEVAPVDYLSPAGISKRKLNSSSRMPHNG